MPNFSFVTTVPQIAERSEATPGLFNRIFSVISSNFDNLNSGLLSSSNLSLTGTFNVRAYGAIGDGVTNDSAAIQTAINSAASGTVFFPAGTYLVSNLTCYSPTAFLGTGRGSVLKNTTPNSFTLKIERNEATSIYRNVEGQLDSVLVKDLAFVSNRVANLEGLVLNRIDHSYFENIAFEAIKGPGLHLANTVRESTFQGITMRWCGSSATNPSLLLDAASDTTSAGEGHNGVEFLSTRIIYSHGPLLRIDTSSGPANTYQGTTGRIRDINFTNFFFHGAVAGAGNFDGSQMPDSAKTHPLVLLNDCFQINFKQGRAYGAGNQAASFWIRGSGNTGATDIYLTDFLSNSNATSSLNTDVADSGISIDPKCSVFIDNAHITHTRDIVAPSTASIRLGTGVLNDGTSSISSQAYGPYQLLSGVFTPKGGEPLYIQNITEASGTSGAFGQLSASGIYGNPTPAESNLSNTVRMYGGSQARIQVFPVGAASQPWEIDNVTPNLRFYLPGYIVLQLSQFQLSAISGTAAQPFYSFSSNQSIGFYLSDQSSIALSAGTLDLAVNSARLSMRTLGTSQSSLNMSVNEVTFSILGASGASLAIRSGGTIWIFNSSVSTKG